MKYSGKNRTRCPQPTPSVPLTLWPKPFSTRSRLVAFTDGSLYKLFMGWDGHLSPEAKSPKQFSLSSPGVWNRFDGHSEPEGLEGLDSICQAVFLCWMLLALGRGTWFGRLARQWDGRSPCGVRHRGPPAGICIFLVLAIQKGLAATWNSPLTAHSWELRVKRRTCQLWNSPCSLSARGGGPWHFFLTAMA